MPNNVKIIMNPNAKLTLSEELPFKIFLSKDGDVNKILKINSLEPSNNVDIHWDGFYVDVIGADWSIGDVAAPSVFIP